MPLAVESLTPDSSDEAIRAAISASIETCMKEGTRKPEQCKAIAYAMARKQTRTGSGGLAGRQIRAGLGD